MDLIYNKIIYIEGMGIQLKTKNDINIILIFIKKIL